MIQQVYYSDCCGKEAIAVVADEGACYWRCSKCNKGCDALAKEVRPPKDFGKLVPAKSVKPKDTGNTGKTKPELEWNPLTKKECADQIITLVHCSDANKWSREDTQGIVEEHLGYYAQHVHSHSQASLLERVLDTLSHTPKKTREGITVVDWEDILIFINHYKGEL
jgi:hypothetical protein